MDKNLILPFINACAEILFELLQEKAKPGQVTVIEKSADSQGMAVNIGITGSLCGRIIIDLSYNTGRKISEVILQEEIDEKDDELLESAVGELGNMIVGRAVSMLNEMGISINITPPTIFKAQNLKITDKNPKILMVPLSTKIGNFILNLSVQQT